MLGGHVLSLPEQESSGKCRILRTKKTPASSAKGSILGGRSNTTRGVSPRPIRISSAVLLLSFSLSSQAAVSFENATEQVGLAAVPGEPFLAFGDYDSDGDPDLLVNGRKLFRNDSTREVFRFVEVTKDVGLGKARGPAACFFDFDLDGWLDIGSASGELWINDQKGSFVDFTKQMGIVVPHGRASAIAWGDVDGDGYLDLVTGGDTKYEPLTHFAQSCWQNSPRKKPLAKLTRARDQKRLKPMRDVSAKVGISGDMYGRSIIFCDFDWDGDEDVYSGNYHLKANFLFRNDGGVFTDVAADLGVTGRNDQTMFTWPETGQKLGYRYGHTIGASWADLNNDGYFDLWVSNLVHKYTGKLKSGKRDSRGFICDDSNIFINQGPPAYKFRDERLAMGIETRPIGDRSKFRGDELWSNAVCGDLDNNGWVDTFVNQVYRDLSYSYGLLFLNDAGQFEERHKAAGIEIWGGYGSAFADIDSDGRLDVVVCGATKAGGTPIISFFKNVSEADSFIGFDIKEAKGLQTVGTKVLLIQEDGVQLRQVASTMGSGGQQNDGRVHFGLGSGGAVVDVLVYWPDGRVQALGAKAPDEYHVVKRKGGRRKALRVTAPAKLKVGEEGAFACAQAGKGWTFYWDFEGSRRPEVIGGLPEAKHRFAEAGTYVVTVLAVHSRLGGVEARVELEVIED